MTTTETQKQTAITTLMSLVESPSQILIDADGEITGIQLFQRGVTDKEMKCFQQFSNIESLGIGGCSGITDEGLAFIAHLKKLTFLDLQDTGITDAGLIHVSGLTNLRTLDLNHTQVTDLGVRHLEGLTKLKKLIISEDVDGISNAAYDRLMAAIPDLSISNY